MTTWIKGLPTVWKVVVTAGGIFAAGLGLGGWGLVTEVSDVKAVATDNAAAIVELEHDSESHTLKLDRIICLLTLTEDKNPLECEG